LEEQVNALLRPLEIHPTVLYVSAGADGSSTDRSALQAQIQRLPPRRVSLRTEAVRVAVEGLLADLESITAEQTTMYSLNDADMNAALDAIAARRDWLRGRIDRAQRRVDAVVMTVAREQLLRRVETFSASFGASLPEEIGENEDARLVRRHLPAYIERVWQDFMAGQAPVVQARLAQELAEMDDLIKSDLDELLCCSARVAVDAVALGSDQDHSFAVFVGPSRGDHRAASISRSLSLQGFIFLVIPWFSTSIGLLSLAASQVIDRLYKAEVDAADRQAMARPAVEANREVERQARRLIQEQFEELGRDLKERIRQLYEEAVQSVVAAREKLAGESDDLARRRQELLTITGDRLPRLRRAVAAL
jgi:hypothetical protein